MNEKVSAWYLFRHWMNFKHEYYYYYLQLYLHRCMKKLIFFNRKIKNIIEITTLINMQTQLAQLRHLPFEPPENSQSISSQDLRLARTSKIVSVGRDTLFLT